MKRSLCALLVLGSFSAMADQIVTGANSKGDSTRSYVENSEVVIATCAKYSIHNIKEKCEEVSRKTYSSREDFMQQAIYNLITYGSKNEEVSKLIEKARKLRNQDESLSNLKSKEANLKKLELKKDKIEAFGKQSNTDIKYSSDYKDITSKIAALKLDIDKLKEQEKVNQESKSALNEIASLVAKTYEDVASNDKLQIEDHSSFNNEVIKLLKTKKRKDLSKMSQFKQLSDYSIEEILTQNCKKGRDIFDKSDLYEISGGMKLASDSYEYYQSFHIKINEMSNERVEFSTLAYGGKKSPFYSGPLSELESRSEDSDYIYSKNYGTDKQHFIRSLLKDSSICHDVNKISRVTGKMTLEDLANIYPKREKVKAIDLPEALPIINKFEIKASHISLPTKVLDSDRNTIKETKSERRGFLRIFGKKAKKE